MATLIPSYEKVLTMKVKPEEGELHLLKFLDNELDSSFEVYFNPFMNGDRPDIVIMRKGYGVMVIEVKDYNLDLYELDDRKNFVIKSNKTKTKAEIEWLSMIMTCLSSVWARVGCVLHARVRAMVPEWQQQKTSTWAAPAST